MNQNSQQTQERIQTGSTIPLNGGRTEPVDIQLEVRFRFEVMMIGFSRDAGKAFLQAHLNKNASLVGTKCDGVIGWKVRRPRRWNAPTWIIRGDANYFTRIQPQESFLTLIGRSVPFFDNLFANFSMQVSDDGKEMLIHNAEMVNVLMKNIGNLRLINS